MLRQEDFLYYDRNCQSQLFAMFQTCRCNGNYVNFHYMLEHLEKDLGLEKSQVLHTAQSLHHDHVPARAMGLHNAWIDRQGLANSENWGATARVAKRPEYDFIFQTMGDMARAVENEAD